LQNIPIRTEQGRKVRRAFVAEPGWRLIAADYSQVELRILAHVAEDSGLLQAFANDEDIHAATAAAVLGVPLALVDKEQRRLAKTVNYGLIYGQTAFGVQGNGTGRDEAGFINAYFKKYPAIKGYLDHTKKMAVEQGYATTLYGRPRDFSHLARLNQRGCVEQEALAVAIQGSAAGIMKQAMVTLHAELKKRKLQTRLLLQLHDELVLEAPEDEVAEAVELAREVMSSAFELRVPLKVEVEVGQNWLEMD
jgi:DNA polymerase-1